MLLSFDPNSTMDQDFTEIQRHVKDTYTSFKFGVEIIRSFFDGQS